ncbi:hypothetical protein MP228_009992 [Amoeboaphelidium protococcarum]|nr:hypothetical protein MP228_009992 [Amoeboaphelidium protococcarum]
MNRFHTLTIEVATDMNLVITYAYIPNNQIRDERNHIVVDNFMEQLRDSADTAHEAMPYVLHQRISHDITKNFIVVFIRLAEQNIDAFANMFANGFQPHGPRVNYCGAFINATGRNLRVSSRSVEDTNFNQRIMEEFQYLININHINIDEMVQPPGSPLISEGQNDINLQTPEKLDTDKAIADYADQIEQQDDEPDRRGSISTLNDVQNTQSQPKPIQSIVQKTASSSSVLPPEESDSIVDSLRNVRIDEGPEILKHVQVDSEATVDGNQSQQ